VAIKTLIHDIPAFTGAFYRVFFSIIFMFIIFNRKLNFKGKIINHELSGVLLAGLCSIGIPFSLLFWGERFVSPSMAGVINGTVPLWTLLVSVFIFGDRDSLTSRKILGLVTGFIGLGFIFFPKISLTGNSNEIVGLLSIVGMALFYSIGINLNKKVLLNNKLITGNVNTILQQIVSVAFLLLLVLLVEGVPDISLLVKPENSFSIFYLSLFSTCIAFIIFYKLIIRMGPVTASTVTFFVPPISLGLDAFFYNRQLSSMELIGAAVIVMSMVLLKDRPQPSK
jgi:drug/metabolite transporter (DMT)-like permease